MTFSGADADALEMVGARLEHASGVLRSKGQSLRSALHGSPWSGAGADRFRSEFDSVHLRAISEASRFLDDAYEALARNAREQRDASQQGAPGMGHAVGVLLGRLLGDGGWLLGGAVSDWLRSAWGGLPRWLLPAPFPSLFPWMPRNGPVRPWFPLPPLLPIPSLPDWFNPGGWWTPVIPPLIPGWLYPPRSPDPEALPPDTDPGFVVPNEPPRIPAELWPRNEPDAPRAPDESLGRHISAAEARRIADAEIPANERHFYDFANGDGKGNDWYQCTVWAKARWREMGGDDFTLDWSGNGDQVAHNINQALGRPDEHVPTAGAIVSTTQYGGHVAVVEEVRTNTQGLTEFRVSEMNMGGNGWRAALSEEFRDSRWIVQQADGSWIDSHGRGVPGVVFASYPG